MKRKSFCTKCGIASCVRERISRFMIKIFLFKRAPEPDDIFWENLSINKSSRFVRTLVTYFLSLFIVGIAGIIIYYLIILKRGWLDRLETKQQDGEDIWKVRFVIALISIAVTFINKILKFIVRFLSKYERAETYSSHNNSVAFKMLFSTFINTIIVPLIIYRDPQDEWFTNYGLL